MWLFASYEVTLPRPILIKSDSIIPIELLINLKGWDAEISLFPNEQPGRIKLPNKGWHYPLSKMEITVARNGELGDEMVHEEIAKRMLEHLMAFLHYRQHQTSLFACIEKYEYYLSGKDKELTLQKPQLSLIEDFDQAHMHNYLSENFDPPLCRALLDDAIRSIINQRQRRACIELTMACETALGMRLENAHVAKISMGDIFAKQQPEEFEQIVQLFKTRDAVKHSSNGLFKFISNNQKQALAKELTCWKGAVECLVAWLNVAEKGMQEAL